MAITVEAKILTGDPDPWVRLLDRAPHQVGDGSVTKRFLSDSVRKLRCLNMDRVSKKRDT